MKFSTKEDIAVPIDRVFAQISDFSIYERQALRRGADVRRLDAGEVVEGSSWDVAFTFRGRDRKMRIEITALEVPNQIRAESLASGISGVTEVDLLALSPGRTRLAVSIDLTPKTLAARLMIQSLKLAKANLTARFKKRVADYAEEIEDRHRSVG